MSGALAQLDAANDRTQLLLDRLSDGTGLPRIAAVQQFAGDGVDALLRATMTVARLHGAQLALDTRLLTERAVLRGLKPQGRISPSGATRLVQAADGWVAISLPRTEDIEALPAWLGIEPSDDPWPLVEYAVAQRSQDDVVGSGQQLSLAVAAADLAQSRRDAQWLSGGRAAGQGPPLKRFGGGRRARREHPLVIDLSALWAGPLCGHLLQQAGARVIKVESRTRPDGARAGNAAFYDLLNAGKESVVLDFRRPSDLAILRRLIAQADAVIESSRPRAFVQLGLAPETLFAENQGLTWISITAYGRTGPWRNRVGFGDDCAAAGGLLARDVAGNPLFAGDALADPLTGVVAAAGGLASLAAGGGFLIDASLRETAAFVAATAPLRPLAHAARTPTAHAADIGQDTTRVLAELAVC